MFLQQVRGNHQPFQPLERLLRHGRQYGGRWMRQGDYKAVLVAKPYGPAVWQLFDVTRNPGETRDLAKEKPEILRELQAAWDRYAKDVGVVLPK